MPCGGFRGGFRGGQIPPARRAVRPMLASLAPESSCVVGRVPDLESRYLGSNSSWPLVPLVKWGQWYLSDLLPRSPYETTGEADSPLHGAGRTRGFLFF